MIYLGSISTKEKNSVHHKLKGFKQQSDTKIKLVLNITTKIPIKSVRWTLNISINDFSDSHRSSNKHARTFFFIFVCLPFPYAYNTDLTSSSPEFCINPTHSLSNVPIFSLQILMDLSSSLGLKENHRSHIRASQAKKESSIMSMSKNSVHKFQSVPSSRKRRHVVQTTGQEWPFQATRWP